MYEQLKFLFKVFNSYVPKKSCTELPFVLLDSCIKLNSTSLDHQFRSRWCLHTLKCLYMHSTPSPRSFSNVWPLKQFQWVWVMTALAHPFKEDRLALPLSTPLSSRQLMVWCSWLCAHRYCPQPLVTAALPASLPAQSFPFTAACPVQHTRQSACSVISLHSSMSSAAHPPVYLLSHFPSQQHVQGSTPASLPAQSFPFTAACPGQHTRQSTCSVISLHSSMSSAAHPQEFPKRDVDHWHIPAWASSSTFYNKLIEFMRMMARGLTDASWGNGWPLTPSLSSYTILKSIQFLFQWCQHHPVVPTSSKVIDNWNWQP